MNYVLTAIVIFLVTFFAWLIFTSGQTTSVFNAWMSECRDRKGFVTMTDIELFATNYECVGTEGEVIELKAGKELRS